MCASQFHSQWSNTANNEMSQIKKLVKSTTEFHSAKNRNELLVWTTWMNLQYVKVLYSTQRLYAVWFCMRHSGKTTKNPEKNSVFREGGSCCDELSDSVHLSNSAELNSYNRWILLQANYTSIHVPLYSGPKNPVHNRPVLFIQK